MRKQIGNITLPVTPGATFGEFLRVILSNGVIALANNAQDEIGVLEQDVISTDVSASVIPYMDPASRQGIASGQISLFATVYADNNGQLSASGTYIRGISLTAASGAGAVFEYLPQNASLTGTVQGVTYTGVTGANSITFPTNLADGLDIVDSAAVDYLRFVSTTGAACMQSKVPLGLTVGTLAAAGTTGGSQAQIVNQVTTITGANGTKAVKLPSPAVFGFCVVINTVATQLLPVCQYAAETIDGTAAALTIPGGTRSIFWSDGTNWWSLGTIDTSGLPDYATVAAAGTNQGTAAGIASRIVTITGADGTKGVKLPAPAAGLEVIVVHTVGTKSLPVYGNGTETINGVGGATGVQVLGGSSPIFRSDGTNWYVAGAGWDYGLAPYASIAAAGTNQGSATPIATQRVIVTASNGTKGVSLPAPAPGMEIELYNSVATSTLHVYGYATENVQGIGGATGITVLGGGQVVIKSDGTNWFVEGVGWDYNLVAFASLAATGASTSQANAAAIASRIVLVTSSNGTKCVKLPAPAAGLTIEVTNTVTTAALPLFGNATENVDGVSGATVPFLIPAGETYFFKSDGTNWFSYGRDSGFGLTPYTTVSASQSSGQANGTPLTSRLNIIDTSVAAGYVTLPPAAAGETVTVCNNTTQTITLYGNAAGGTINGTAGATGISVTTGKSITLFSDGTNWIGQAAS